MAPSRYAAAGRRQAGLHNDRDYGKWGAWGNACTERHCCLAKSCCSFLQASTPAAWPGDPASALPLNLAPACQTAQVQSNALAALEALDPKAAEMVYGEGCITGDRINGLCDGITGEW